MSSVKDKFSRKVRITFARTEQKLRPSRYPRNESEIDTLERFHTNVKKQKSLVGRLNEQWKKYLTRTQEAEKTASAFECTLLYSLGSSEEAGNNVEKSSTVFPNFETCDLESEFNGVLERIEVASKNIKDAESLKRDYLANQSVYEKAHDQKKEQEKQAMEESRKRLTDSVKGLDQCIPQILDKNDEELYQCTLKYFTNKCEYLEKMLLATKKKLDELKDARSPSSAFSNCLRSSFSPSPPPGYQSPSNGSTVKEHTYSQASNAPPASAANGHETKSMMGSTHRNASEVNGAEASRHDQANEELTSRTPPFDVIAAFTHTSKEQDELGFKANDRITVLPWEDSEDETKNPEPGWLYGKNQESGLKGLFPANYVKLA